MAIKKIFSGVAVERAFSALSFAMIKTESEATRMDIKCTVQGQKLTIISPRPLPQGSDNFDRFLFTLSEDWDGLMVFAQFRQNDKVSNEYLSDVTVQETIISDGGTAAQQHNVTYQAATLPNWLQPGPATMTLYGTGREDVIGTTNYVVLLVVDTGLFKDAITTDLTESLYQQMVNRFIQYEWRYDVVQNYLGAWEQMTAALATAPNWTEIPVTTSETAPSSPHAGDFWYDKTNSLLKRYISSELGWATITNATVDDDDPPPVYYFYDNTEGAEKLYRTPICAIPTATASTTGGIKLDDTNFRIGNSSAGDANNDIGKLFLKDTLTLGKIVPSDGELVIGNAGSDIDMTVNGDLTLETGDLSASNVHSRGAITSAGDINAGGDVYVNSVAVAAYQGLITDLNDAKKAGIYTFGTGVLHAPDDFGTGSGCLICTETSNHSFHILIRTSDNAMWLRNYNATTDEFKDWKAYDNASFKGLITDLNDAKKAGVYTFTTGVLHAPTYFGSGTGCLICTETGNHAYHILIRTSDSHCWMRNYNATTDEFKDWISQTNCLSDGLITDLNDITPGVHSFASGVLHRPDGFGGDSSGILSNIQAGNHTFQFVVRTSDDHCWGRNYNASTDKYKDWISYNSSNPGLRACIIGASIEAGTTHEEAGDEAEVLPDKAYLTVALRNNGYTVRNYSIGSMGYLHVGNNKTIKTDVITDLGNDFNVQSYRTFKNIVDRTNFANFDVCYFCVGSNDWASDEVLGSVSDAAGAATVCGMLKYGIEKAYRGNIGIKLFVKIPDLRVIGTPTQEVAADNCDIDTRVNWTINHGMLKYNSADTSYTLNDLYDAIETICQNYYVEVIKTAGNGIVNAYNLIKVKPDGSHPNQATMALMARNMTGRISFK